MSSAEATTVQRRISSSPPILVKPSVMAPGRIVWPLRGGRVYSPHDLGAEYDAADKQAENIRRRREGAEAEATDRTNWATPTKGGQA